MRSLSCFFLVLVLIACETKKETKETSAATLPSAPKFNGDSAYLFVARQVAFGPRVPGTKAHQEAGDYFIRQLKQYGATVSVQNFEATTWDNQRLKLRNIMASFHPEKAKRILLAAHWDTRPYADKDSLKRDAPFDGANDGASGTGVLLEIARVMQNIPPAVGVDILFFDGEDWGEKHRDPDAAEPLQGNDSWWCLGSQYWAKHKKSYNAYYGILLDMVGAKGAHFFREGVSAKYAPKVVDKVWQAAERLGYSGLFVNQPQAGIQDDHIFVNEYGNIPMIDIVDFRPGVGYFGDYHHSLKDNMDLIGKETLAATGTVVLNVLYAEPAD